MIYIFYRYRILLNNIGCRQHNSTNISTGLQKPKPAIQKTVFQKSDNTTTCHNLEHFIWFFTDVIIVTSVIDLVFKVASPTLWGIIWLLLIVVLLSLHDFITAELETVQTRNLCLLLHVSLQAQIQCRGTVSDSVRAALRQICILTIIIIVITQRIHAWDLCTTNSHGTRTIPVLFVIMIWYFLHWFIWFFTNVIHKSQIVPDCFPPQESTP